MGVSATMTVLGNLINPEVMTDMISATLPKKIKFSRIAGVDTTLEGREGDTVTIPKYAYIGDAEDVAEGVALGTVSLTATTTKVTVKKAGKATEISDEAILSAHGDTVGESVNQLAMAVASKIDDDCVKALNTATLKYDGSAGVISYEGIVKAIDLLEDESDTPVSKVIFVHPKQVTQLRLDADFRDLNKYPMPVIMTGAIGSIAGAQVIVSARVTTDDSGNYVNPIVVVDTADSNEAATADKFATSSPALTIYLKRAVNVETDRDILKSTNVIKTDEHYVVALTNDSKVVLATFKA